MKRAKTSPTDIRLVPTAHPWRGNVPRRDATIPERNTFAGGPEHGAEYLVDSNLDWGQDLKGLKGWMVDNKVEEISLAYFGTADPRYYGIQCVYLPGSPPFIPVEWQRAPTLPGYVAVSATLMSGAYVDERRRDFYKPLLALAPVASIGHTINVYRVESRWW